MAHLRRMETLTLFGQLPSPFVASSLFGVGSCIRLLLHETASPTFAEGRQRSQRAAGLTVASTAPLERPRLPSAGWKIKLTVSLKAGVSAKCVKRGLGYRKVRLLYESTPAIALLPCHRSQGVVAIQHGRQ